MTPSDWTRDQMFALTRCVVAVNETAKLARAAGRRALADMLYRAKDGLLASAIQGYPPCRDRLDYQVFPPLGVTVLVPLPLDPTAERTFHAIPERLPGDAQLIVRRYLGDPRVFAARVRGEEVRDQ